MKKFFFLLIILFVLYYTCSDSDNGTDEETKVEALSPEEIQKKKSEDQFHPWDGSHIKLERYIKTELMNDPDSYDHVESGYTVEDGKLYVMVTFRGNNAFGGKVKNKVLAICDKENGDVIEIVEVFTD